MKQHDANGRVVADFLKGHAKVEKVFYPGLAEHPHHELAKRQQSGFGSMISIELGSLENANGFASSLAAGVSGGVAGWGGDADLPSGDDDACGCGGGGTGAAGDYGWADADLGGD